MKATKSGFLKSLKIQETPYTYTYTYTCTSNRYTYLTLPFLTLTLPYPTLLARAGIGPDKSMGLVPV